MLQFVNEIRLSIIICIRITVDQVQLSIRFTRETKIVVIHDFEIIK